MDNMDEIYLSDNLKVSVEPGAFGKFIRFSKTNRWITLNEKTWRFLKNNIPMLSGTFESQGEWGVMLTSAKTIRVGQFKGNSYVCLTGERVFNGKHFESKINLNEEEWKKLLYNQNIIDAMMAREMQYSLGSGAWVFLEDMLPINREAEMKRRLVPLLDNEDVLILLESHLLSNKICEYKREYCLGCSYSAPDQYSHYSGCLQDWQEAVSLNYEDAKNDIKLKEAVNKLNEAMNWDVKITQNVNENEIRKIVGSVDNDINKQKAVPCNLKEYALPSAYYDLFNHLKL